ncbi:hypothetical protein FA95DRAFT_504907 [Auriscalpium vulgare]|uniref:Uncharacterized protein n=1 Tax=Auriscalpium vulgare TaxID=40419 RepID=A0ACB8RGF3_9AGAM|nr:hypothetical protein FA95DRAFT_504907 [Auriscalpium vulgare]
MHEARPHEWRMSHGMRHHTTAALAICAATTPCTLKNPALSRQAICGRFPSLKTSCLRAASPHIFDAGQRHDRHASLDAALSLIPARRSWRRRHRLAETWTRGALHSGAATSLLRLPYGDGRALEQRASSVRASTLLPPLDAPREDLSRSGADNRTLSASMRCATRLCSQGGAEACAAFPARRLVRRWSSPRLDAHSGRRRRPTSFCPTPRASD